LRRYTPKAERLRSIPPHEWFFDLLGEKGNIATAQGKRLNAIMAIADRFNAISEILSTAPSKYAPIFQRTDDGVVFAGPWCMGFVAAMKLRWKAWAPLLDTKTSNAACYYRFYSTALTNWLSSPDLYPKASTQNHT
jgi:yecA family protein